jgi:ornithine cyclodeaminase/alanine dehydrogenase-like protein (mu-crystallin family)
LNKGVLGMQHPNIFNLEQIKRVLPGIDPIKAIEEGFLSYSQGKAVIPPVGELIFKDPPGEAHIKYGCIKDEEYYVIKIASGFYNNIKLGIPPNTGLMLLFKQQTGELAGILLDEGYLTNIRTAAAGAVAAKYLAPRQVSRIGIFGAGVQGRMQIQFLKDIVACKKLMVWGMNEKECNTYKSDMESLGYDVETTLDPAEVAENCNLLITATPAKTPLLKTNQIRRGTHITAMGSDTPEKNELEPGILQMADIVVADSLDQCQSRGEIFKAVSANRLTQDKPVELGNMISGLAPKRKTDDQITVADLTGVAIQDIQVSVAVYNALKVMKEEVKG